MSVAMRSCAFVLAMLMMATASLCADQRSTYDQLCQNQEVDLRRISEVRALIEFVKSPDSMSVGCDEETKRAILDIEETLEVDNQDNHCTPERVLKIVRYIRSHIKAADPTEEQPEPAIPMHMPKSLKRFFIGYSLIVSKVCKLGMLKLLMHDSKELVDKQDYREVTKWTEGSDLHTKVFLNRAVNYDDMFMVGNAICDPGVQTCREIYVQTEHWKTLQGMRVTCHRVFKPFYEALILPIVRLANAGIDYSDSEIRDQLDDFREDSKLQNWYKIVFLCESILHVVPLDVPADQKTPQFHLDEETLKKLEEEELEDHLEPEPSKGSDEEADADEEEVVEELDEPCEPCQEGSATCLVKQTEDLAADEKVDCKDGKKVIVKKNKDGKKKKKGNFLTRFGKDIVKEMRKLQQERKAYLLSRKKMPVTTIMTQRDVAAYIKEHGPIKTATFDEEEPPVDYKPKPAIHVSDNVIPDTDKRIVRAIKQYEKRKLSFLKSARKMSKRYFRMFRRVSFIGRVRFGGEGKQRIDSDELMFKVMDKAMWEQDNQELVKSPYGRLRKMFEFQNLSNVATCVSLSLGIIFFMLQTFGPLAG